MPLFHNYKLTSRHLISVPENEKTLAILTIRVQLFSFITLSMCHLNNCSKTVMKYHAPTPSHKSKEAQGNYWEQREEFKM